ncbi:MAG TPA: GDSL-type esterase/lipase family protein [Chitinophagaceae bacterium]|nr:GDSL-type esterase/lipase family protein [Chitinophagaceae bacterium]
MKYCLPIFLFILFSCKEKGQEATTVAQPPFWNDIQNFKKQDSNSLPPKNAILFIGSSSFTMWKGVQDSFPGYTIINRGFGGSTLMDQIHYENDVIFPYQPKQIVIYCGENDLASSDTVSAGMVFERFKILFNGIRAKLPDIPIAFVSLKPSPNRRHLIDKMRTANVLIRDYLATQKNAEFIDIHSKMLNAAGQPIPDIFLEDSLHMNEKGYAIWTREIQPHLLK